MTAFAGAPPIYAVAAARRESSAGAQISDCLRVDGREALKITAMAPGDRQVCLLTS
jgi:hypothetical protein